MDSLFFILKRFFRFVCFALCILSSSAAYAAPDLSERVRELLYDELPDLSVVLPGYVAPPGNAPSLAMGDFYTESSDKADWGRALGEVLRTSLTGHLDMPSRRVARWDAWQPGIASADLMRSEESLALYHQRYGTQAMVTGRIVVKETEFHWTIHLMSLPERQTLQKMVGSGTLDDLPEILEKVRVQILKTISFEGAVDWIDLSRVRADRLKEYARLLGRIDSEPGTDVFASSAEFITAGYDLIPPILIYIEHYPSPVKRHEIMEQQEEFTRLGYKYPESAAVKLCMARNMMPTSGVHNVLDNKVGALKKYVSRYPDDPMGFVLLADVLSSNNHQLEGIAVSLEALRRWPGNFRAWWGLAWGLDSYAWRLRGTDYWNEVPDEAKRMFPKLKAFALKASQQVVALNRDNAKVWHQKMRAIGNYNHEFKDAFNMAVGLDPDYRDAYETALNYAAPKWGGSVLQQEKVLELARQNNPNATWVDEIADKYVTQGSVKSASLFELTMELISRFLFE